MFESRVPLFVCWKKVFGHLLGLLYKIEAKLLLQTGQGALLEMRYE